MTKPCYGNYMLDVCEGHYKCREYGCFNETSKNHGTCDCKHKASCHLGRQELQVSVRNENSYGYNRVEQCAFYQRLDLMMELYNNNVEKEKMMK